MTDSVKNDERTEANEAQIAVHWKEEKYIEPPKSFVEQAILNDPGVRKRFDEKHFPDCFREYADMLTWFKPYTKVLDTSHPPFWKWFTGGKLNACYNCVDRHLDKYRNKAALIFVSEPEDDVPYAMTYQELYVRVNEMAALLKDYCGLKAGDRVTLHLPMTLDLPITMLACARLGVIHSQVFAGFSGQSCGQRIQDSGSHYLITIDAYWRSGKLLDHKANADIAVKTAEAAGQHVDKVLIWQRYPGKYSAKTPLVKGRDVFVNDVLKDYKGKRVEPAHMDAEAPLFLMYSSGTTGKPKGCQHRTGGYLAYVAGTSKWIQDIHPEDTYWCMADIGWITGHSYIVYGPLALAATSVIYEGTPTYPDVGRPWRIAERLGVNIFHTSPTAVRALRRLGENVPKMGPQKFKHMTTVGEPIEPKAWHWYFDQIGKGKAVIVDTWWQTENGGFLCSTIPALDKMKPGSAGPALPGIYPVILDDNGKELPKGSGIAGNMCIRNPWPGIIQTIWGDDQRFIDTYYRRFCKYPKSKDWRDWPYMSGDGAVDAPDGYYRILGRIDDVINVSGHRLGTKELENACLTVPEVSEAAVVPVVDEIRGKVPEVYVSVPASVTDRAAVAKKVIKACEDIIGKIARPSKVHVVPDMPKTRSGKIMRRVLASISNKRDIGDVTTLANPEVVEKIRVQVQGK
ncbi:MAG: acetate--CoA ligase [Rhodanobacteraceae bacterium]|nr:MAG: acetate--CoA ligase [Rhodanobacteraceae bacterium]